MKKVYKLKINLGEHPATSVVVYDDMIWLIGNKQYDTRGNIGKGEIACLLAYLAETKATTILEPMS